MSDTEQVSGPDESSVNRAPAPEDPNSPASPTSSGGPSLPGDGLSEAERVERAQNLVDQVDGDLHELEREYRTARSAIADEDSDRRSEAADLLSGGADRHELIIELVSLRSEFARQGEALSARDEHVKSLREQVGDLEDRLERTNATAIRVTELENENRRLAREAEKLGALLDAREVERDEIAAKLRSVEVDKVQLRRETESLQTDMSSLDTERSEMRKQVQKLEAELIRNRRDHEARHVQLEASAEERNEMSKKLSSLQEDRAVDLGRINELEGLIERRDNEINHLKKTAARNEAELTRIGDAATELELRSAERDKLRRRVESLESELTAQTTEAGASKKALELLASRTSERDELEKRVIELERDLTKLTANAASGQDVVSQLEARTDERNKLEQHVIEIEALLARERMQNAEWRETADLVATMTTERDKLRRRVSVLESELESTTASVPLRSQELHAAEVAEIARAEVAEKVETVATATTADDELMARIAALEAQLNEHGAGPASRAPQGSAAVTVETAAAAAAFDEAMAAAAEMREKLAKAAELLGETSPLPAGDEAAPEPAPKTGMFSALTGTSTAQTGVASTTAAVPASTIPEVAASATALPESSLPDVKVVKDPLSAEIDRSALDEQEPLWALRGSNNAETDKQDDEGPSDQVYNMYKETLKNLEYDEASDVDTPAVAGSDTDSDPLSEPAARGQSDLATALFSRSPASNVIPGVDLAMAPPPTAAPIAQPAPAPLQATPAVRQPAPVQPVVPTLPAVPASAPPRVRSSEEPLFEGSPSPRSKNSGGRSDRPAKSSKKRRRSSASPSSVEAADAVLTSGSHLLIDGNGVVAQTRYPHRFLDAVERLADRRNLSVELVFDGSKVEATPALATREHVQVRFAQGVDVGDVIARLLDTIPANTPTVVATDDGRLRSESRKLDADVVNLGQLTGVVSR